MFQLLKKLYQIHLLSPTGLFRLLAALWQNGSNLMALLAFAAKTHPTTIAIQDEQDTFDYQTLHQQTQQLALILKNNYQLKPKQKVAIICSNHAILLQAMFALSRLGLHLYLLNVEMSAQQLKELTQQHNFQLIIHDKKIIDLLKTIDYQGQHIASYGPTKSIQQLLNSKLANQIRLKRYSSGDLIILTGGTTGTPKAAARKPSIFTFLNPFFALLTQLNLNKYKTVYVPTPIYHGFGTSAVLVSIVLGAKILVRPQFDAITACQLIEQEQAEVVTLVPTMLQRMLQSNPEALKSLQIIISGGAPLSPNLVDLAAQKLGKHKVANLYGTTEAGFSIMATPQDLQKYPNSIGKAIMGVRLKVLNEQHKEVAKGEIGRICIKNKWVMASAKNAWVDTGDCGYQNSEGFCFLSGRVDDMIVSGGENVYPIELEHILLKHAAIQEVAVIGIPDLEFGQRLKAFVVLKKDIKLNKTELLEWLKQNAARYQQPAQIVFLPKLPYTALGKLDKKALN